MTQKKNPENLIQIDPKRSSLKPYSNVYVPDKLI